MADATIPADKVAETLPQLHLLQDSVPLRESLIWRLQTAFYERLSIRAWSDSIVPNFVTSNAFIAAGYARVILGFLRDWFARPEADLTEPVHIFEVGAGHGRLSFLVLRELFEARASWPALAAPGAAPFKFVVTDFAEKNVAWWRTHERFAPYFAAGVLDVAVFNGEADEALTLQVSGKTLGRGSCKNPVVTICNYIFDTLRQDAFRVVDGQLQAGWVATYSDQPEPSLQGEEGQEEGEVGHAGQGSSEAQEDGADSSPTSAQRGSSGMAASSSASSSPDPDIIRRMRCVWEYKDTSPEEAYPDDPHLAAMLRAYTLRMSNASILVPIGGIGTLRRLAALHEKGKALLLAGDKAYNHEEELTIMRDPHVAVHGSFSFMTNFHAVRLYALARGGFGLHSPFLEGFKCSAFAFLDPVTSASPPTPDAEAVAALADVPVPDVAFEFPDLLCAWADVMDTFGPDNFSTLQRCVRDEAPAPSLKTALAVLRLSLWDSDVFFKFKQVFIEQTPNASERLKLDVWHDLCAVADRYYALHPSKDIAFELGRIAMALQRYKEAIALFEASQRQAGEHHVTWYNQGICYWYLSQFKLSHACFQRSLALRPDYADAVSWRVRVEAAVQGAAFLKASGGGGEAVVSEGDLDSDEDTA